ncbi:MAG: diaminobutyrate--2-oxoglutarate transaminase [Myxococcota bacterium]|nr:diaminobutyrate--2-oxoglutarate transaminase [Myxococcota bacterium]
MSSSPAIIPATIPAASEPNEASTFERLESNVRSYCRAFPTVFTRAKDAFQWDEAGRQYLDFFSGAGALNYGHNPDSIKRRLLAYLESDGVIHGLDMYTSAKRRFLETLEEVVLRPRGLEYKVQFCGPTGTNAVEAAMKLARRITGRYPVFGFTGGYHGMSLGSLAITANRSSRIAAGVPLPFGAFLPFADGPYRMEDSLGFVEAMLEDANSGIDLPAAIVFETIQSEGGIYLAPIPWLQRLRRICDKYGIVLICDDIQTGCGRTGTFFSFERAGIVPDMVTLSKSIGGYGLPMSLVLMRPALDVWNPAEHTGTFRGHQLAFVGATAALDEYWRTGELTRSVADKARLVEGTLAQRIAPLAAGLAIRGAGLLWGIDLAGCGGESVSGRVARKCFERGLIVERCGREDTVLKIMPPLTIDPELLIQGLSVIEQALREELA